MIYQGTQKFTRAWARMGPSVATPLTTKKTLQPTTGDVVVSSVYFQLTSELDPTTPTFNLTCISTGGPATTVTWTRNSRVVTDDNADDITSQVLTDAEMATYNHTLMVTGRLVGVYECNVSNNKPSSSSKMQSVVGA